MSCRSKFDSRDLNPAVLHEALQSQSDYFISKHRIKVRETTLGVGGFATGRLGHLWSGSWMWFLETPATVAVKELRTAALKGEELRIAFRLAREMKVWASCKHENVLEFWGYHLSKDFRQAYLISPYMKNGNITEYLAQKAPPLKRRLELVRDTARGLRYLHSRDPPIVHRDLKPPNVLINDEGKALLSDFGLAEAMGENSTGLNTSNGFKGTIRYCSPEVCQGSPPQRASDIWAWGCLALEAGGHIMTGTILKFYFCFLGPVVVAERRSRRIHRLSLSFAYNCFGIAGFLTLIKGPISSAAQFNSR
ncbi:hypothetical protein M407DRAFT_17928 [Tulasnella calospora MUT 4182]|uniref:Protein kinase domain-containing protein n=1 Tax=Tulasnella calospora MUT 4182 TaxID=1051891 RepID=A0A0C3MH55_9AGAM|nr:hypothetical protein M407DRAFT_17928 [Tulasnella calospora MUT 4182]